MDKAQKKTEKIVYVVLFLIAFAVAFSSTYNPFNFRRMHVDSSVYMTIAKGITQGQLPYGDFVDNKGPFAYLLSVPGLMLGGFTGIWITELILLWVSVFFAYKTALFFGNKHFALTGTACSFAVFLAFFTVCAGTEEYSLPFLMIALYIFTRYYFSPQQTISLIELIAAGICFACAVLIRLNMFPLWAGFCAVIFIESILKRRFALLAKSVFGFCAGIIIVFAPVFLYLKLNGILDAFIYQVIRGGAAKGFSGSGVKEIAKNFFIVFNRCYSFAPLFWGIFLAIKKYKQKEFTFYAAYVLAYILTLLFLSFSSGDSHYNVALVPFFVPALASMAGNLYAALSKLNGKNRTTVFVLFLCIIFSEGLLKYLDDSVEIFTNDSGKQLINAGKMIDENTKAGDKIISLGINGYIYPFTARTAASKYIYQGSGIDLLPESRNEFLSDILNGKPAIIAIFTAETNGRYDYLPDWYAPIYVMIENEYKMITDQNGYLLFKLTGQ
jgi:hypothetical protein